MKTKIELTWIGKENRPKLEPRILLEDLVHFVMGENRIFSSGDKSVNC